MEREYISYIHDGSDTQGDNFTIVANQTEIRKHSLPCTVHVKVTPVNDEIPVVAVNKGLKVGSDNILSKNGTCSFKHLLKVIICLSFPSTFPLVASGVGGLRDRNHSE